MRPGRCPRRALLRPGRALGDNHGVAALQARPEAFEDIRLDVAEGGLGYHDPDGRVRGTLTPYQESGPGILTVPTSSGAGSSTHTGMLAPLIDRGAGTLSAGGRIWDRVETPGRDLNPATWQPGHGRIRPERRNGPVLSASIPWTREGGKAG